MSDKIYNKDTVNFHTEASKRNVYLLQMEERAARDYIPIITAEVAHFLQILIKMNRPIRILELGTAIGYSSILMAEAAGRDVEIVTIEIDEKMADEARINFKNYGIADRINLKIGDALEIIPYLRRKFDFVFIDAAKGQYPDYLKAVFELVPENGVIAADNVLYRGLVNSGDKIKHKHRTMIKSLRKYLEQIQKHKQLMSSVIPIGDGVALSVKLP
ncbi:MAG: O-methyltransferase [Halanaerobiales bacterium]